MVLTIVSSICLPPVYLLCEMSGEGTFIFKISPDGFNRQPANPLALLNLESLKRTWSLLQEFWAACAFWKGYLEGSTVGSGVPQVALSYCVSGLRGMLSVPEKEWGENREQRQRAWKGTPPGSPPLQGVSSKPTGASTSGLVCRKQWVAKSMCGMSSRPRRELEARQLQAVTDPGRDTVVEFMSFSKGAWEAAAHPPCH